MRRVSLRLLPFLFVLFVFNYIDRTNVAIASLQMNSDLGLSATAFGFGVGIFFLGYILFEVPSNVILARVGARRWIARIVISWGLVASSMTLMRTPVQFYVLRVLLGVAEAGFFPGIIYYLGQWFPARERASATSRFMISIPLAAAIGNPLGVWVLGFNGRLGLRGWQWIFLVEGVPSVLLGIAVLMTLTDRIEDARWLSDEQRDWLAARLRRDQDGVAAPHGAGVFRALTLPLVWLAALTYFMYVTAFYGYTFWAPIVIRDTLHTSNVVTGLIAGLFACMAAAGMLIVGVSSDRTGERCLHASGCAVLTALGYIGAALLPSPPARMAAFALVSVGTVSYLPAFWCLPAARLHGSAAAAAIAAVNSVGNAGGFVGPYIIGWVKDATGGTTVSFLALAAFALAAAALLLVMRRVLYSVSDVGRSGFQSA
jgi:ACS family tartrate transporter-like MFS transporter